MKKMLVILILLFPAAHLSGMELTLLSGLPEGTVARQYGEAILSAIERRTGMRFNIRVVPIRRLFVELEENKVTIAGSLANLDGLEKTMPHLIKVSEPIAVSPIVGIAKKQFTISGWQGLSGFTLCHPMGLKVIEQNVMKYGLESHPLKNAESALKFVISGRAQIYVVPPVYVAGLLESDQIKGKGLRILKPPIDVQNFHTYFFREHAGVADRYNRALKAMKKEGEYQAIVPDWFD